MKTIIQFSGNVYTPDLSYIYTLEISKKDLDEVNFSNMVEHMLENWHLLYEEIRRWRDILGTQYGRYKLTVVFPYAKQTPAVKYTSILGGPIA